MDQNQSTETGHCPVHGEQDIVAVDPGLESVTLACGYIVM